MLLQALASLARAFSANITESDFNIKKFARVFYKIQFSLQELTESLNRVQLGSSNQWVGKLAAYLEKNPVEEAEVVETSPFRRNRGEIPKPLKLSTILEFVESKEAENVKNITKIVDILKNPARYTRSEAK